MKQKHRSKPAKQRKIALERIDTLFAEAKTMFKQDQKLANRYISLARRIAMKYKVTISPKLRRQFCSKCGSFLVPAVNARIRTREGHVVQLCLECKNITRIPYK